MTEPNSSIAKRIKSAIEIGDMKTMRSIVSDRKYLSAPLLAFIGLELQNPDKPIDMQDDVTDIFLQTAWEWGNEHMAQGSDAPQNLKLLLEHNLLRVLTDISVRRDNWVAVCDHVLGQWSAEEIFTPLSFSWAINNNRTMFEQFLKVPHLAQLCHRKNDRLCQSIVQEQSLSMAKAVLQWAVDTKSYTIGQTWVNALCKQVTSTGWGPLSHDLTHPSAILDLVQEIEQYSGHKFNWNVAVQDVTPYEAANVISSPILSKALDDPETLYATLKRWFNTDYMESISYQSLQAHNPDYVPSGKVIDRLWLKLPATERLHVLMKLLGDKVNGNVHHWEAHDLDWNEDSLAYVDHLCALVSVEDLRMGWIALQATHPHTAVNLWRERPLIKNLLLHDRLHEELDTAAPPHRSKKM